MAKNRLWTRRLQTNMRKVCRRICRICLMIGKTKFNQKNKSQQIYLQFCLFMKTLFFSDRVVTPDAFCRRGSCFVPPSGDLARVLPLKGS